MALVQLNRNPSAAELRWFGLLFAAFFAVAGLLASRGGGPGPVAFTLWGVGAAVPALYYAVPPLRRPIYLAWIHLAYPVGLAVSYLALALIWGAVFTPTGFVLRLLGRDPLARRFEPDRPSYWIPHVTGADRTRYFDQY